MLRAMRDDQTSPLRDSDDGARADQELSRHLRTWGAGETDSALLVAALDGSEAADAAFWRGVARVETGDLNGAAALLRRWLAERGPDAPVMATHATALLLFAETGLVEALRWLFDECGDDWSQRCPFAVDRAVHAVADADPALLAGLLRGYPGTVRLDPSTRVHAAHRMLELACEAPHAGLAASRLELAERLLGAG